MVPQKPKYCKNFERNSHWRKLSMIMVWERYCNASPKPEFFLFSLFIFAFISQLIWVRLGWNFHRWFSIQKQVNWCTIDPFSLKFCTSQHSHPVPLSSPRLLFPYIVDIKLAPPPGKIPAYDLGYTFARSERSIIFLSWIFSVSSFIINGCCIIYLYIMYWNLKIYGQYPSDTCVF